MKLSTKQLQRIEERAQVLLMSQWTNNPAFTASIHGDARNMLLLIEQVRKLRAFIIRDLDAADWLSWLDRNGMGICQ
jgi:hypothetical protein